MGQNWNFLCLHMMFVSGDVNSIRGGGCDAFFCSPVTIIGDTSLNEKEVSNM